MPYKLNAMSIVFFFFILNFELVNAEERLNIDEDMIYEAICPGLDDHHLRQEALCVSFINETLFNRTMKMCETNICEIAKHYNHINCGDHKHSLMIKYKQLC